MIHLNPFYDKTYPITTDYSRTLNKIWFTLIGEYYYSGRGVIGLLDYLLVVPFFIRFISLGLKQTPLKLLGSFLDDITKWVKAAVCLILFIPIAPLAGLVYIFSYPIRRNYKKKIGNLAGNLEILPLDQIDSVSFQTFKEHLSREGDRFTKERYEALGGDPAVYDIYQEHKKHNDIPLRVLHHYFYNENRKNRRKLHDCPEIWEHRHRVWFTRVRVSYHQYFLGLCIGDECPNYIIYPSEENADCLRLMQKSNIFNLNNAIFSNWERLDLDRALAKPNPFIKEEEKWLESKIQIPALLVADCLGGGGDERTADNINAVSSLILESAGFGELSDVEKNRAAPLVQKAYEEHGLLRQNKQAAEEKRDKVVKNATSPPKNGP